MRSWRLRDFAESDTILEFYNDPAVNVGAWGLPDDARLVDAAPFADLLERVYPILGVLPGEDPTQAAEQIDERTRNALNDIETELLTLEKVHGRLWEVLAAYVRTHPTEFFTADELA
jgi:hypothetical protein